MKYFAQAMINHSVDEGGSIVNIASIVGKTSKVGLANYASSKAGVDSMTRVASKEFGKFNIRVNVVLPGYIRSPMTDNIPDKIMDSVIQSCAMKRLGEPEGKQRKVVTVLLIFWMTEMSTAPKLKLNSSKFIYKMQK